MEIVALWAVAEDLDDVNLRHVDDFVRRGEGVHSQVVQDDRSGIQVTLRRAHGTIQEALLKKQDLSFLLSLIDVHIHHI